MDIPMENNVSGNCHITPSIDEALRVYFRETWSAVMLVLAFLSTFVTVVLFFYSLKKIREHNPVGSSRRRSLTMTFGLFPVFAVTSLCGIIIPRAAETVDWVTSIYLAITVYSFLELLTDYFGGTDAMLTFFQKSKVSYAQAPFACCCKCLPEVYMTRRQFLTVRYMVLQVTIVRPFCVMVSAVLWSDSIQPDSVIQNGDTVNSVLGFIAGLSTGFAIYGLQIYSKSASDYLSKFYIKSKFIAIQLVLITSSLLSLILDIMQQFHTIMCVGPFSSPARSQLLYNHIIIHVMVISFLSLFLYWIWLSRFSSHRDEVDHAPEIPENVNGVTRGEDHHADDAMTVV